MPFRHGDAEAIAIHGRLLSACRDAVISGDFGAFLTCHALPTIVVTWDGASAFDTPADLRRVFDGMLAHLAALSVTRYEQSCISAHFLEPTKIEAIHEDRLYDRDGFAAPPSTTHSILGREDDRWRVAISRHEVEATPILRRAYGSGRPLTAEEAAQFGWEA